MRWLTRQQRKLGFQVQSAPRRWRSHSRTPDREFPRSSSGGSSIRSLPPRRSGKAQAWAYPLSMGSLRTMAARSRWRAGSAKGPNSSSACHTLPQPGERRLPGVKPWSVLIVDDDPALLQALPEALRLRMSGVVVDTADSAVAALDRIAARDYEAIVTDIKMPGMDGLALLAVIRERRPDTPVLIITGHNDLALAIQALRNGAYDFIAKPIDRDSFVVSLQHAILAHELS